MAPGENEGSLLNVINDMSEAKKGVKKPEKIEFHNSPTAETRRRSLKEITDKKIRDSQFKK